MILRLSSPAVRWAYLLISAAVAVGLGYFSLRNAWAEHQADPQEAAGLERATKLEPGNAHHWYLLGRYWQYNLEQPDTARAIALYQRALSLEPHAAGIWLDLAESQEAEGELKAAREAFLEARTNYPVSADVAWRYGNFLLRQGETDAAFAEIQRSLAEEPRRAAEAISVCWRAKPDIRVLLDQALPASPQVYLSVIEVFAQQWETDAALAVWRRLAGLRPKLELKQVNILVDALLAKRQVAEAREVWTQALDFAGAPRPGDPAKSLIWDGGFETGVSGGFAWRLQAAQGAQMDFDSEVRHSGNRALRIRFDGKQNPQFENVCQFVAVTPETPYQLEAWMRAKSVTTDRGVYVLVRTPEFPTNPPAMTVDMRETQPWTRLALSWTAGKDVHLAQVCLGRAISQKLDNQISGTVWVDDFTLTPESAPRAASPAASPAEAAAKERP
ncbi:MAG: tetratricopeptide repeat protein [Acidobacteriia bacterium]|nr:tetratricopeptide repeat protein [Terriglobia bacterium]